jgi:hypothetical protein
MLLVLTSAFAWIDWRQLQNTSVSVVDIPTGIRTAYLGNRQQDCQTLTSMFGVSSVCVCACGFHVDRNLDTVVFHYNFTYIPQRVFIKFQVTFCLLLLICLFVPLPLYLY